jgi:hypothetical protein
MFPSDIAKHVLILFCIYLAGILTRLALPVYLEEIRRNRMASKPIKSDEPRTELTNYTTPNRLPKPMRDDMARFKARMERERRNAK